MVSETRQASMKHVCANLVHGEIRERCIFPQSTYLHMQAARDETRIVQVRIVLAMHCVCTVVFVAGHDGVWIFKSNTEGTCSVSYAWTAAVSSPRFLLRSTLECASCSSFKNSLESPCEDDLRR